VLVRGVGIQSAVVVQDAEVWPGLAAMEQFPRRRIQIQPSVLKRRGECMRLEEEEDEEMKQQLMGAEEEGNPRLPRERVMRGECSLEDEDEDMKQQLIGEEGNPRLQRERIVRGECKRLEEDEDKVMKQQVIGAEEEEGNPRFQLERVMQGEAQANRGEEEE